MGDSSASVQVCSGGAACKEACSSSSATSRGVACTDASKDPSPMTGPNLLADT